MIKEELKKEIAAIEDDQDIDELITALFKKKRKKMTWGLASFEKN